MVSTGPVLSYLSEIQFLICLSISAALLCSLDDPG